jgi:hypothetical protein
MFCELGVEVSGNFGDACEDLEESIEFARGLFDFEKDLVVALDLRGIGPGGGEVGVSDNISGPSQRRQAHLCYESVPYVIF